MNTKYTSADIARMKDEIVTALIRQTGKDVGQQLETLSKITIVHVLDVYKRIEAYRYQHMPKAAVVSYCKMSDLHALCRNLSEEELFGLFKHVYPSARYAEYGGVRCLEFTTELEHNDLIDMGVCESTDDPAISISMTICMLEMMCTFEKDLQASGYAVYYRADMHRFVIENDVECTECITEEDVSDVVDDILGD